MLGRFFRFGPFRFDAKRYRLYRDGRPVALGSKAAILLRMLLAARGDIVSKSDLMDAAWPSLQAEVSNLTVQMSALRRCLSDDRKRPRWIETCHRSGYRFAGDLDIDDGNPALRPYSRDWPTVLVMPFQLSENTSLHACIVEGFREQLIAELARLTVRVLTAADNSTRACDYLIGGRISVRQRDVLVETTIADRRSGYLTKKACEIENDLSELFRLQAEISGHTASRLSEYLSNPSDHGHDGLHKVAERHLDRGCKLLVCSHSANRAARSHIARAVQLDPGFARAHAFLGIGHYTAAIHYAEDVQANRALALAHAKMAVSLSPGDSTVHGALGFVKLYDGHISEAEDCLLAACHYDPNDSYALMNLTELRVFQGRHEDAIANAERAVRVNDRTPNWYYWVLAFAYYSAERYSKAVEALANPGIEMFPGKRILAASLAQLGHLREARLESEKFLDVHSNFAVSGWSQTQPFMYRSDRRHFIDGFLRAGFPR